MPTLSPQAIASFLSMLVGIYGVMRLMGVTEHTGFQK